MSDRVVREQRLALEQRLAHTEGKLRAVALRAWPGAVRSDASFTSYVPETPSLLTPLVAFNIPAGRWIALGSVTFIPTPPYADSQFQIFLSVVDAVTGASPTNPLSDLPPCDVTFAASGAYPTPSQTGTIIGDVVADEAATVTLSSVSNSDTPYTASLARLRMMPV
jgi:hypothetical protein